MSLMVLTPAFMFGFVFLIVLTIIDFLTVWKKGGYIPSILTTMFLIISFIITGFLGIYVALLCVLITLLFVDLELFDGIADFKIIIASGMLFPNIFSMTIFMTLITILAVMFKSIFFKLNPKMKLPFIPVILVAYVTAWGLIR